MIRTLNDFIKRNNDEMLEIRTYFQKCAEEVDTSNLYMLRHSTMWISLVFACMFLLAYLTIPRFIITPGHILLVPLLIVYFLILFIDRQYKYGLEETFIVALYYIIAYNYKAPNVFSRDAYTVLAAYILSLIISRMILGLRSKQGLAMVELQRFSSLDKLTQLYNKGALLLEHIGQLLVSSFRPSDIIGRFGGDEFIVFMPGMEEASLIELRCRNLQMLLTDLIFLQVTTTTEQYNT